MRLEPGARVVVLRAHSHRPDRHFIYTKRDHSCPATTIKTTIPVAAAVTDPAAAAPASRGARKRNSPSAALPARATASGGPTPANPTAHAEILAIRQAAEAIGTERLVDCDLYVTLEPCTMCAGAISFARIRRLYYGAADPKGGAVDSGVRFFAQPTCHHVPEVYSAVGETEAATLLKEFFKVRR